MRQKDYIEIERLLAAAELGKRFIQRLDLYAKQLPDGRYVCVRKPLTAEDLLSHLDGKVTLGTYLLDMDSNIRFIVLDADEDNGQEKILKVAKQLEAEGIHTYSELSRRGAHLWMFFEKPITAELGRQFGKGVMAKHGTENVELYPKQDKSTDDGPGSLIRLPFGVHLKSGQRYPFVTSGGELLAPTVREQIRLLANAQTVPEAAISFYADYQPEKPSKPSLRRSGAPKNASLEEIKERISVMEFVDQYIELQPTSSGAVGRCPFHDDQHASFGVNAKGNYWHCFAGCGGGSVIDFWMKWRDIEFRQAVDELTDLLGVEKNGRDDLHHSRSGTVYENEHKKDTGIR